jgi:hypothetical protein
VFTISAIVDTSRVSSWLQRRESRIRSATATALTRVAQAAKREIEMTMPRVFDRPTRWTLGAVRYQPADRKREPLASVVLFKDRDSGDVMGEKSHLWPQVRGGPRHHKRFEARLRRHAWLTPEEYLIPAKGAPLDLYGNVPASIIRQILSQLGAANAPDNSGYDSNVKRGDKQSAQSKRRQLKAGTFFIPRRGDVLPRGIYQRIRTGAVWQTRLIFVVGRRPNYPVRLDMQGIIENVRQRELQQHFDVEMARITQD